MLTNIDEIYIFTIFKEDFMNIKVACGDEKVFSVNSVSRKVPGVLSNQNDAGCLHFTPAEGEREAYHHLGVKIEGVYLNLHFYGLESSDIGRTRTFDVEVFEKTVKGTVYTYVNLYKVDAVALYKMKLGRPLGQVTIQGTLTNILFQKTKAMLSTPGYVAEADSYHGSWDDQPAYMGLPVIDFDDDEIEEPFQLLEDDIDRGIDGMLEQLKKKFNEHNA